MTYASFLTASRKVKSRCRPTMFSKLRGLVLLGGLFAISVAQSATISKVSSNRKMGVLYYQGTAARSTMQWELKPPRDGSAALIMILHMSQLSGRSYLELPNGTRLRNSLRSFQNPSTCVVFTKRTKNGGASCSSTELIRQLCSNTIQSVATWPPTTTLVSINAKVLATYIYLPCSVNRRSIMDELRVRNARPPPSQRPRYPRRRPTRTKPRPTSKPANAIFTPSMRPFPSTLGTIPESAIRPTARSTTSKAPFIKFLSSSSFANTPRAVQATTVRTAEPRITGMNRQLPVFAPTMRSYTVPRNEMSTTEAARPWMLTVNIRNRNAPVVPSTETNKPDRNTGKLRTGDWGELAKILCFVLGGLLVLCLSVNVILCVKLRYHAHRNEKTDSNNINRKNAVRKNTEDSKELSVNKSPLPLRSPSPSSPRQHDPVKTLGDKPSLPVRRYQLQPHTYCDIGGDQNSSNATGYLTPVPHKQLTYLDFESESGTYTLPRTYGT